MTTRFQIDQGRKWREIMAAKRRQINALGFADIVVQSPNKHGRGKAGFSCSISGRQTANSGKTVAEFARWTFGSGSLRRLDGATVEALGYRAGAVCYGVAL